MNTEHYINKFQSFRAQTLYDQLDRDERDFIRTIAFEHRFTFQEFRQVVEASRDLSIWRERPLSAWWQANSAGKSSSRGPLKKRLLADLHQFLEQQRQSAKIYPANGLPGPEKREKKPVISEKSNKKIHGMCPVASEETVCCNLRTIDAVENCAFGCSYCTIQTFYSDKFVFDADFASKLEAIPIAPDRFYHFGTGQSSDSLVWGNKNGNLEALCQFAADHPNVLLEFKTKSNNIAYFLEHDLPENIVCSWSLNTPTIICNEEHFTASLEQRLAAARTLVDRGVKVAFHFHPMIYYNAWQVDYPKVAATLTDSFESDDVLFVSFGAITLIKPAIKKIRRIGQASKILQMEMVPDPHGKLTYPDETKIAMFRTLHDAFRPWQDKVFFYLCMEKASIWQRTFGFVYDNNEEFERAFLQSSMQKIRKSKPGKFCKKVFHSFAVVKSRVLYGALPRWE
ncbi:MAG: radical SAM protein [bacterium]